MGGRRKLRGNFDPVSIEVDHNALVLSVASSARAILYRKSAFP
jgi:hypothetical protein